MPPRRGLELAALTPRVISRRRRSPARCAFIRAVIMRRKGAGRVPELTDLGGAAALPASFSTDKECKTLTRNPKTIGVYISRFRND